MDDEDVGQLEIRRLVATDALARSDMRLEGVRDLHRLLLRFIKTVGQFVDEIAETVAIKSGLEGFADDALCGGLVHEVRVLHEFQAVRQEWVEIAEVESGQGCLRGEGCCGDDAVRQRADTKQFARHFV